MGYLHVSRYPLPAITLYLTQHNWENLHIRKFTYKTRKLDFVSTLEFNIQRHSDHETPKFNL